MSLAELERRATGTRRIESLPSMKMTTDDFWAWKVRRGYTSDKQVAEDLCVPKASVSQFLGGYRPVPPDVARIAGMIDLLDTVSTVSLDGMTGADLAVVRHVRSLLPVWSTTPRNTLPEGHWEWQELRIDRLCQLAAAVHAVTCTTAPRLAKARRKAAKMVKFPMTNSVKPIADSA